MKTLEQLAGWLLFSLSILMVYGFLSLFLIGPTHARNIPPPAPFGWIDSLNMSEQPTFAQMEWNTPPGIVHKWRMDGTMCSPYCKTQTIAKLYDSQAQCLGDFPKKLKKGYTDLSCDRIALQAPVWVMLDEMGKVVDSFDTEAECKANVPGGRASWPCVLERR